MKLIVGLGNPGQRYRNTRHNVGFQVVSQLAHKYGTGPAKSRFHGEIVEAQIENQRALLLCPDTYMNNSGQSVLGARDFYKLDHQQLLIICDDCNLPLAKLRLRKQGSAGGQKGLQNVIHRLGDEAFARLRVGVGPPPDGWQLSNYVLSKFSKAEMSEMETAIEHASQAAVTWAVEGIDRSMNQFN